MVPLGNMRNWTAPIGLNNNSFMMENELKVPTVAELLAKGETPDILFWVGCAGSFDERAQKITRDICRILQHVGLKYAILGTEESCTGDPAKRSGNEFLFQMQAMMNIEVLNGYEIKKIVTACPHCFNTLKNEYPSLGGNYEVIHHTQLIQNLINEGKLKPADNNVFKGKKITYHDPCYLGRANEVYEAPRKVLESLDAQLIELKRCKSNGLCCGAGGGQMFKEPEPGAKDINIERIEEVIDAQPQVVAAACPFCMTMLKDGVKIKEKESEIEVLDIAEITARANQL
ncbi:Anaerobic glycerol-3-phosphate dehydrogenase subunit C [Sphingobacterium multivorum]|uniref:Anaerobic glycerol-3-phosphate dehydrogenase subunit C n=3 Tax=Sphingobacteriaceae TaxID=84566 RepID=A0A654CYZ5_SPHMU|nr:Anaerobic glycerol-3-phosphate dehydrogenase subunit C [Sphingobacterium multivorum]VXC98845.1 Anaerobic glycerol-3-phosphate dehydrogenase subunit C [Sphingobacterium multivorum]